MIFECALPFWPSRLALLANFDAGSKELGRLRLDYPLESVDTQSWEVECAS